MFYRFVLPNPNDSSTDQQFLDKSPKDNPYVTLSDAINIVLFFVCGLGIAGNISTVLIFYRLGLKKSSNLLILSLAVADAAYLLGVTNIPLHIYIMHSENLGFFVSHDLAFFLNMLFLGAVFLETVGKVASLVLPVLIALERIVAVFFPLQFSRIVRPDLLNTLVVLIFSMGTPVFISYCMLMKFVYRNDEALNVTAGMLLRSDDYVNSLERYRFIIEVYITFCGPVCTGIVILACTAVGVKVHMQMKERGKLLGSKIDTNKNLKSKFIKSSTSTSLNTNVEIITKISNSPVKKKTLYSILCFRNSNSQQEEINAKVLSQKQAHCSVVFAIIISGSKAKESTKENAGIALINNKRIKTTKTTKILMSVCVFYSLTGLYGFLSVYILRSVVLSNYAGVVVHRVSILIMCINSGINFFIYTFFNLNFRKQYRNIFCRCTKH